MTTFTSSSSVISRTPRAQLTSRSPILTLQAPDQVPRCRDKLCRSLTRGHIDGAIPRRSGKVEIALFVGLARLAVGRIRISGATCSRQGVAWVRIERTTDCKCRARRRWDSQRGRRLGSRNRRLNRYCPRRSRSARKCRWLVCGNDRLGGRRGFR